MAQTSKTVNLVGVGGAPPYAFSVVSDAGTTIPASIAGSVLTVDASALQPGTYSVHLRITDQNNDTADETVSVTVLSSGSLSITTDDYALQPTTFPQAVTVALSAVGGTAPYTWSLIPLVTTLPGASVSGANLSFSATTFGTWTVGLRVTDVLGNTATRLIEIGVVTADIVSLTDGQVELDVTPTSQQTGTHTFTLTVADSGNSVPVTRSFTYSVASEVSSVGLVEASVDHVWTPGDTTSVVYPIAGDMSGFTVGSEGTVIADNGLTVSIDTASNAVIITGPPTSFQNAELDIQVPILQSNTQVALITREYTLVAHNGTSDVGAMTCNTRPYITGELVGLNPLRPYFNSPVFYKNQEWAVQLASGSSLPQGLSLDANTGQIYGTVLANDVAVSTLNYVDSSGDSYGTVTINWTILPSQFTLIDQTTVGQVQAAYSGTIGSNSSAELTAVSVVSGRLPLGLSPAISTDSTSVLISGTPTEAGYFDIWLRVTNSSGQVAYIYSRFVVDYIVPLVILTDVFERLLTNQAFSQTLQAFGGIAPYVWSVVSGTLPSGLTLNASSGVLSGTTTVQSYNQDITIGVTDTRGVTTTAVLPLTINNTLTITTASLPLVTPGQNYQFQMEAEGGTAPYTWSIASGSPALPGGFSLAASGLLTGSTSLQNYNASVVIQVTDSASSAVTQSFNLLIGTTSGLTVDTEGVGPITRGQAWQGTLIVEGAGVAPYDWTVTPDSPNPLPSGITMAASVANQGETATLSGITGTSLDNYAVKVEVVDANGNYAFGYVFFNSFSSLAVETTSLPQATVSGSYSATLLAADVYGGAVWSLDPSSSALPAGLSLSPQGVLSGIPTTQGSYTLVVRVTDSAGDYATASLGLSVVQSTLAITTTSLPNVIAGVAYSQTLQASGGQAPYTWSVSPSSSGVLPSGLSLAATGVISGTSFAAGYDEAVLFRVVDALGVIRQQSIPVNVVAGLTLQAGPDFVDGTSNRCLGIGYTAIEDVTSISPRPNLSFFVVASNVISTTASGLKFGLPSGFSASVASLSGGIAKIELAGPFYASSPGTYNLPITVIDSGVSVSATFTWVAVTQSTVRITPVTGSLPVLYLD